MKGLLKLGFVCVFMGVWLYISLPEDHPFRTVIDTTVLSQRVAVNTSEVYFDSSITPEDANAIIGILKAQGYFDKTPVTVHLSVNDIDNDGYLSYIVKFVVTDANNWFFLAKMQYLMETISKEAFEQEVVVTVVLCDTFMVPQRIVRSDS